MSRDLPVTNLVSVHHVSLIDILAGPPLLLGGGGETDIDITSTMPNHFLFPNSNNQEADLPTAE